MDNSSFFLHDEADQYANTRAPADSLIYLETNDLAAALQPIIDSKPFNEVAKSKPDFSALKGVQLAVVVTGFESSEEQITEEQSVGRIQPHFVAIIETHAWNFQAVTFTDKKLGQFVTDIYGADVEQASFDNDEGKYFTWTSTDGRKSFAQVTDSLIFFSTDESSIEKCLAVSRDEAESIAKTGKVAPTEAQTLASGYVSPDGIAQIANIIGLKFASASSDDPDVQSTLAGVLPQLIRSSVVDITWTSNKSEQSVNDVYRISMAQNISSESREILEELGAAIHENIYGITAADLAEALSDGTLEAEPGSQNVNAQNHLVKTGIECRTASDFGLIGSIIAQLAQD